MAKIYRPKQTKYIHVCACVCTPMDHRLKPEQEWMRPITLGLAQKGKKKKKAEIRHVLAVEQILTSNSRVS